MTTRTRLSLAFFSVLLSSAAITTARAQVARLGDTIRVHHPGLTEGVLVRQDSLMLSVRLRIGGDTVGIPRADIREMERLQGHPRRGWGPVAYGMGIGIGTGALLGLSTGNDSKSFLTRGDVALVLGGVLGVAGAVIGGVISVFDVEDWVSVSPTSVSVGQFPVDGRVALSVRWRP